MNRRDFFEILRRKTASLAASTAAPGLAYINSISDELKALSKDLNRKLGVMPAEMKNRLQALHSRLDEAALAMSYQQMLLYFIFLLLVLSFAIDAGMTTAFVLM
jgi:hypothetical protein